MIDFVRTVPLVVDDKGNIMPEIRIAKGTVLCLEYPINIYSPSSGLTHQGVGGHFTFRFRKDGKEYKLTFTNSVLLFDEMDCKYSVLKREKYGYAELLKFIQGYNQEK